MNDMLVLNNIKKIFFKGTVNEKVALENINLNVAPGDFVTILGSNGAGKSTMFNAILGAYPVEEGNIFLDGEDITFKKDYKRALDIGCIYQDPMRGTSPHMTIEENLSLAYTRKAKRSFFAVNKHDSAYFKELLATLDLGLENRMRTQIGLLSGGQRQAVSLLMSTIAGPKLLLLDEHTAALDPATAKKVLKITTEIVTKNKITTMMITHDMNYALSCGNRTIMMDEGQIILDIKGEERASMTPEGLVELFSAERKKQLTNDRMMFSMQ